MPRIRSLCATIVVGCVALLRLPTVGVAATLQGTVSEVVDSDTIKVVSRGFETPVRLLGIDTPETRDPEELVQCFGPAASRRDAAVRRGPGGDL